MLNVAEIKNEFNLRDAIFHRTISKDKIMQSSLEHGKTTRGKLCALFEKPREKRSAHKSMLKNEFCWRAARAAREKKNMQVFHEKRA